VQKKKARTIGNGPILSVNPGVGMVLKDWKYGLRVICQLSGMDNKVAKEWHSKMV